VRDCDALVRKTVPKAILDMPRSPRVRSIADKGRFAEVGKPASAALPSTCSAVARDCHRNADRTFLAWRGVVWHGAV
jgi:hypothetical protein